MAAYQITIILSHDVMKKMLFIVLSFVPGIVLCQNNEFKCYLTIEDSHGNEKMFIKGTLCDDTIFYFDNKYKVTINNTKGLEGGHITLYNKNGITLGQLPIIGPHEQDLSKILDHCIYCFPDGRLAYNEGYFIFPKAVLNKVYNTDGQ